MDKINHIFEILSKEYSIDIAMFSSKKPEAEKYRVCYKMAAYFCYKYILENETGITLSDLSKLLHYTESYILDVYERTNLSLEQKRHFSHNVIKIANYIENEMP